jgi:hypothetical protein
MTTSWIGIAISVVVMLSGTAANLFIIGRFVGQWGEATKNIATTLSKVERRVEDVESSGEKTESERRLMDGRLKNAESGVDRFWEMRDEFVTMRTTVELEGKHSREKLDSVSRSVSVIERQIANLVSARAALHHPDIGGQELMNPFRRLDIRGWATLGMFALVFYVITLIAFVPAVSDSELFKTAATLLLGSGAFGLVCAFLWGGSTATTGAIDTVNERAKANAPPAAPVAEAMPTGDEAPPWERTR